MKCKNCKFFINKHDLSKDFGFCLLTNMYVRKTHKCPFYEGKA